MEQRGNLTRQARLWAGVALLLTVWCSSPTARAAEPTPASVADLNLPTNGQYTTALDRAARHLEQREWDQAIELLQQLIDVEEDQFLSIEDPQSVKAAAAEKLSSMPTDGRQQYSRAFDAASETLVSAAQASGSLDSLSEAVRRFFHTDHGLLAAARLAGIQRDLGDELSAAMLYDRLARDPVGRSQFGDVLLLHGAIAWLGLGDVETAVDRVKQLQAAAPRSLVLDGQEFQPPKASDDPLQWLSKFLPAGSTQAGPIMWSTGPRGDGERNAQYPYRPAIGPPAWTADVIDSVETDHPDEVRECRDIVSRLQKTMFAKEGSELVLIPAATPVVVQDRVVFRGYDKVKSVWLKDGSLHWPASVADVTFQDIVDRGWDRLQAFRDLFLGQRAWRDATSASLSTDGDLVYAVSDAGMLGSVNPLNMPFAGTARQTIGPLPDNRLHAFKLRGGKLVWSIGGERLNLEDEFSGLFFLGPPLAHDGRLHCLVEDRGQVRLLVLDPTTLPKPTRVWSQALYNLAGGMTVDGNELRRTAGLTPACSGDVLICPTGAGGVVAVDARERRLLWSAQYEEYKPEDPRTARMRLAMSSRSQPDQRLALDRLLEESRWRDAAPLIVDDKAIVTAPESQQLVCLSLADGKILWQQPRGQRLYLAGAAEGTLFLVGASQMEAIRVADGTPAWKETTPLPAPSGIGYRHGLLYTLPLESGEIVTIDLTDGRVIARSPLASAQPLGNLVSAGDRLIVQSATGVMGFRSQSELETEITARLEKNGADAEALALRGEMRLHSGQEIAALADLRQAVAGGDTRVRRLLVLALLDGLRVDFASYRNSVRELESLVAGTPDESMFRRLYALGLERSGERDAAFLQFLNFSQSQVDHDQLQAIDGNLLAQIDCWVRGRLESLLARASDAERDRMLAALAERIDAIVQGRTGDNATLARLAYLVSSTSLGPKTALELLHRDVPVSPLQLEQVLLPIVTGSGPERPEAIARLARMYLQRNVGDAAAPLLAELRGPLASTPCLDATTGAELVAQWETDEKLKAAMTEPFVWPAGPFTVSEGTANRRFSPSNLEFLPILGPVEGPLRHWQFQYDANSQDLHAFDPNGQFQWKISLLTARSGRSPAGYLMIRGHLILMVLSNRLILIDPLASGDRRIIASEQLSNISSDGIMMPVQRLPGLRGAIIRDQQTVATGTVGTLTFERLCFQRESTVHALDPVTGRRFWSRSGLPEGCDILADDSYVVLKPADQPRLIVLNAIDGSLVATRDFPEGVVMDRKGAEWGRLLLTVHVLAEDRCSVGMYDPATGETLWTKEFDHPPQWSPIDGSDLAFFDHRGRLTLSDPVTGKERFETTLKFDPARAIESLTLISTERQLFASVNYAAGKDDPQLRENPSDRLINGELHALDHQTGQVQWTQEVPFQLYNMNQPASWPVLPLAARQRLPKGGTKHVRMVLDKQTGKNLLTPEQTEAADPANRTGWEVNIAERLIRLTYDSRTLDIRCGEVPKTKPDEEK